MSLTLCAAFIPHGQLKVEMLPVLISAGSQFDFTDHVQRPSMFFLTIDRLVANLGRIRGYLSFDEAVLAVASAQSPVVTC